MSQRFTPALMVCCVWILVPTQSSADVITIGASKDNTLYETVDGSLSNGAGEHFFVGRSLQSSSFDVRRGLLAFDIAGAVPAGSLITGVELTLSLTRTRPGSSTIGLHSLEKAWGEGTSDASGQEGQGTAAVAPDATWLHAMTPGDSWTNAGGDFNVVASDAISVGTIGSYTWGSTASMVSDVQAWLDSPATNFGWLLLGDEVSAGSAKRFASRTNFVMAQRPSLEINFTAIPEPSAAMFLFVTLGIVGCWRYFRKT